MYGPQSRSFQFNATRRYRRSMLDKLEPVLFFALRALENKERTALDGLSVDYSRYVHWRIQICLTTRVGDCVFGYEHQGARRRPGWSSGSRRTRCWFAVRLTRMLAP